MNSFEILNIIKQKLDKNFDIKYREIQSPNGQIMIIYADSMCDSKFLSQYIVEPLIKAKAFKDNVDSVKSEILYASSVGDVSSIDDAFLHILSGDAVIVFSFYNKIIYCEAKGFSKRSITVPTTENGIKGPREGFSEPFIDNVSLLRRRIKDPNLKFESMYIGNTCKTVIVLVYIQNKTSMELLKYIKKEIGKINVDGAILSSRVQEQFQCKHTVFDTAGYSEKPETIASKISEGRIAIIVDGSPFVISLPYFFFENFQVTDDYSYVKYFGNGGRLLRWFAFVISTLLPGFYIAIVTHHFSLIPYSFVFRLAISRAGVPFPTVVEVLVMMVFFQISREAGIRLPQPIGQSMSIVGALILGNATVGAGIASQTTLIIVALSAISSFLIPKLYGILWYWSIIITAFSASLGLPGFYIAFCIFVSHMAGLTSCGYPFLFPLGTLKRYKFKDILIRDDFNKISRDVFEEDSKK